VHRNSRRFHLITFFRSNRGSSPRWYDCFAGVFLNVLRIRFSLQPQLIAKGFPGGWAFFQRRLVRFRSESPLSPLLSFGDLNAPFFRPIVDRRRFFFERDPSNFFVPRALLDQAPDDSVTVRGRRRNLAFQLG